ncbi:MAG TPA: (Fe-S)-binding protein [Bacteroidia bacterium]|nr:(Fe-S)-binding protein [Bacteroidia bacterium]HNT79642.1 (Fe-S)-binding protein [Bacteroidia bacterium]
MIVDIFIPCFIDQLYPQTAFNIVKILERVGCGVNYPVDQTCCGHSVFIQGDWDACKFAGEKFILELQNERYIVSPSASCTAMVKNFYPEMFHNSSLHNEYKSVQKKIYELSDFLISVMNVTSIGAQLNARAVFMDTCHSMRECSIQNQPRELLKNVKGLELVEMEKQDVCCGFGGHLGDKFGHIAEAMAKDKVEAIVQCNPEIIIGIDMGCLVHVQKILREQNSDIKIMHLADVLASGW